MKKAKTDKGDSLPIDFRRESPFYVSKKSEHWFIRYKIYHLLFWFVYHYLWMAINVGNPVEVLVYIFSPKFLFYVIFQAIAVYFNLYYLIPRYLVKSKYISYLLYFSITTVCTAVLIVTGYYLSAYVNHTTLLAQYGNGDFMHYFITYTLPSTLTSMFLAMSIKLTRNWIQSQKREHLLETQKLENELKFLRSQLNPHFLFNTINSIFVLIHKNPDMASEALAKFSNLLRYQLYECNENEIALSEELHYLENYIELEKLRLDSKNTELVTHLECPRWNDLTIAPLLLIPFVENAFKHVSIRKDWLNRIFIELTFDDATMKFKVTNSVSIEEKHGRQPINGGGIGLQNVQRRLNLIYGDRHQLNITQERQEFCVSLDINLHRQSEPKEVSMAVE